MAAFRYRKSALAAIAIVSAAFVYAQQSSGGERSGGREEPAQRKRVKPPERKAEGQAERQRIRPPQAEDNDLPPPLREAMRRRAAMLRMPDAEVVVMPLQHANPWEVMNIVSSMKSVLGERLACYVVGGESLLVATDDQKALKKARDLVAKLDRPQRRAQAPVKTNACKGVPLKNAYALEVARHLGGLAPRGDSGARVVADQRANTVWIAGAPESVEWFVDIALRMDKNAAAAGLPGDKEVRALRFYAVEHADAVNLAKLLTHLGAAMDLDVTVVPDQASGALVVHGTSDEHAYVQAVVEKLDTPAKKAKRQRPPAPKSVTQ